MRKTESGLSSTGSEHLHKKEADTEQYLVDSTGDLSKLRTTVN